MLHLVVDVYGKDDSSSFVVEINEQLGVVTEEIVWEDVGKEADELDDSVEKRDVKVDSKAVVVVSEKRPFLSVSRE